MIARTWHGVTLLEKADEYYEYLLQTGVQDYKATPGNLGVHVFRRIEGDQAHFVLISYWESLDGIRAFAGNDVEAARYYSKDSEYLVELALRATHYEVLMSPDTGTAA
jgi:heme-degrading monooxygenase HmoA